MEWYLNVTVHHIVRVHMAQSAEHIPHKVGALSLAEMSLFDDAIEHRPSRAIGGGQVIARSVDKWRVHIDDVAVPRQHAQDLVLCAKIETVHRLRFRQFLQCVLSIRTPVLHQQHTTRCSETQLLSERRKQTETERPSQSESVRERGSESEGQRVSECTVTLGHSMEIEPERKHSRYGIDEMSLWHKRQCIAE